MPKEFIPTHASLDSDGSISLGGYIAEKPADLIAAVDALAGPTSRRHKALPGDCSYCDRERAGNVSFHPPHDASSSCGSGKHNHCSCDTCF